MRSGAHAWNRLPPGFAAPWTVDFLGEGSVDDNPSEASNSDADIYLLEDQAHGRRLEGGFRQTSEQHYRGRILRMGAWLSSLFLGYILTRIMVVKAGIPHDGERAPPLHVTLDSISKMMQFGLALGWFHDISSKQRAAWLFSWRRWYVHVVYLATSPVYSYISDLPGLQHSLVDILSWGSAMQATMAVATAVAAAALLFQGVLALRRLGGASCALYVGSRLPVAAFYAAAAVWLRGHGQVHVHHYLLGWALALFAEFNHPVSGLLLAIGCGIFVQGVGAYSFAPVLPPTA